MTVFPPYCVHTADIAAAHNEISPNRCRSINELLDVRAKNSPARLAVAFPQPTEGSEGRRKWKSLEYTFAALRDASLTLADHYASQLSAAPAAERGIRSVAMLCPSGPTYLLTMLACIRLGFSVLLLAPQLNADAVHHLIEATDCSFLLIHPTMLEAAPIRRKDLKIPIVRIDHSIPPGDRTSSSALKIEPEEEAERTAIFFHSSGSSGMPKPIATKHRHLTSVYPCCPADGSSGSPRAAFSTTPLFHGGLTDLFRALNSIEPIYFFPLHLLPVTAENVVQALECAGEAVTFFFTVPFILKLLLEARSVTPLTQMTVVSTGGAPLSDEIGNDLVQRGVPLVSRYGSSECGFMLSSFRDFTTDREWQWLREPQDTRLGIFREFRMIDDTTAELVIHKGWPHQVLSNQPDGSYATGDLFTKHPSIVHAWRYAGRSDDILVMSNGEKADPGPLEARLRSSPLLRDAVVFGADRPAVGVLLLFQPRTVGGRSGADLIETIWPEIVEANKLVPTHSQLLREMVVPLVDRDAEEGFPTASKGSIQRKQVYARYKDLIDRTYRAFEAAGTSDGSKGLRLDESDLQTLITDVITATLGGSLPRPLDNHTDLFVFGLNSLQTARVRNVLQKRLDLGGARLASNVVYEHPSVKQLAAHIVRVREGETDSSHDASAVHQRMRELTAKYAKFERGSKGQPDDLKNGRGDSTLLTGATGSLGAHLLALLLEDDRQEVICLVRARDNDQALRRVQDALRQRCLPGLSTNQLTRLHCFAAKTGEAHLGLDEDTYSMLLERTTCIVHLAWPVNFVASLDSFETENIAGVQRLGELALHARMHPPLLYGSSVASVLGHRPDDGTVYERWPTEDPTQAPPMGYSRSKWVAEKICQSLAQTGRVKVVVLRIGQLCGDTQHGFWNETEGWPLMVKSVDFAKCLPDLKDALTWLPVDLCARSILEVSAAMQAGEQSMVLNLANIRRETTWQDWLRAIKTHRPGLQVVPVGEWLDRLEGSESDDSVNPSRKLLGVWRNQYCNPARDFWEPVFDLTEASRVSPTVAHCESLHAELLLKMTDRLLSSKSA